MDTKTTVAPTPADKQAELDTLLAKFATITDPKERKEFYTANPRLSEVYSAANFS